MIIYNKTWLANLLIRNEVKKAGQSGEITPEELRTIEEKYPVGFYMPNMFIRLGLFILTCVICLFSGGLITLIVADTHLFDTWGYFLFLGAITYTALEVLIRNNHHFRSGVDDALIWVSGGLFLTSFIIAIHNTNYELSYILIYGFIFLLALYYSLRFADILMTATSLLSFIALVFFGWKNLSDWGMITMPFLVMALSASIYFMTRLNIGKKLMANYNNCLVIIQLISLLTLYLAGNYYVIQMLDNMASESYSGNEPVPFAPFFWAWTVLIPFVYLYFGIKKKDVIVLRTGLLLVAAAAFTFRNYFHVTPIEATLSIIGVLLLSISYSIIKYLKTPKYGFTYEDLDEDHLMDKIKVESLILSETFSSPQPQAEATRFGGGEFGGGGASSNY